MKWIYTAATMLALTACSHSTQEIQMDNSHEISAIDTLLNGFHLAASEANGEAYFGCFHQDGVFLGTDKNERWGVEAFKAFAEPYFSKGKGCTYKSQVRNISLSQSGKTAWFDEQLHNEKYGNTRGSGALVKEGGQWKITQYVLSFPVPNEVAGEAIKLIQAYEDSIQTTP